MVTIGGYSVNGAGLPPAGLLQTPFNGNNKPWGCDNCLPSQITPPPTPEGDDKYTCTALECPGQQGFPCKLV